MGEWGRIVIPASVRESLGIREGDNIHMYKDGRRLILSPQRQQGRRCIICGAPAHMHVKGRALCKQCIKDISHFDEKGE